MRQWSCLCTCSLLPATSLPPWDMFPAASCSHPLVLQPCPPWTRTTRTGGTCAQGKQGHVPWCQGGARQPLFLPWSGRATTHPVGNSLGTSLLPTARVNASWRGRCSLLKVVPPMWFGAESPWKGRRLVYIPHRQPELRLQPYRWAGGPPVARFTCPLNRDPVFLPCTGPCTW